MNQGYKQAVLEVLTTSIVKHLQLETTKYRQQMCLIIMRLVNDLNFLL